MSRARSLARNVASNWFLLVLNVVYAFFITPIIVRALDKELYGVWSFLNGLLAYSGLLYFGLGSAVIKSVAQYRAANDHAGINRIASIVLTIFAVLGLSCFGLFAGLSTKIAGLFADPLSADAARGAIVACVLLGARLLLAFLASTFACLMAGHDRFDLVNTVGIVVVLARFVTTPLLVRAGHEPLITLAWLSTITEAFYALGLAALSYWYVPRLSIRPVRPKLSELRLLYGFGLQSFFIVFGVKLISYTDTTVIGLMLGAASVALYSLPLQLVEYARLAISGFSGVLLPQLTILATTGDLATLRKRYLDSARIACFLSGWLAALIIALGPSFLSRWVSPEFGAPVQWVLVCLAVAGFGQVLTTQVPIGFYQSLHVLAFPAAVLMAEALLNVALSVWLAPRLGLNGVAIATLIPALFVSVGLLPPYLCRKLEVPVRTFVLQSVVPGVLMLLATLLTQWMLSQLIDAATYPVIALRALTTLPIAALLFAVTFPSEQQLAIRRLLLWRL
jgi:O-antigen/teichoic acid export membrane protein